MEFKEVPGTYWSDSTVVLTWIKHESQWEIVVKNRVKGIRQLTNPENWRYVPGENIPADLPSRGCSIEQFVKLKWWEGPTWLEYKSDEWSEWRILDKELLHSKVLITIEDTTKKSKKDKERFLWYYRRFYNYQKIVRLVKWIKRFIKNCKQTSTEQVKTDLTVPT